jgi:hypothetical protein
VYTNEVVYQHGFSVSIIKAEQKVEAKLQSFLTSALDGVSGQIHAPTVLCPAE